MWNTTYEKMKSSQLTTLTFYKFTIIPLIQIIIWLFICLAIMWEYFDVIFGHSDLVKDGWFSTSLVLFVLFFSLAFYWYIKLRKIFLYKNIFYYLDSRDSIISENKNFEILIKEDFDKHWIDADIILRIKKSISSILKGYALISKYHKGTQEQLLKIGMLMRIFNGWLMKMIDSELQWIVDYSQEFTHFVQSWISHHATELAELEKQIASQELSTENIWGKAALEISRMSLQEHLKELEKVRV